MTKSNRIELFYNLYMQYHKSMWIHAGKSGGGFYSYLGNREIVIEPDALIKPSAWDIFAFLHEIGHIMTNTTSMKRYEQEYLATQWAIDKAKEIGFDVPEKYITTYQNYIWKWRETSIKHKAKNVASKESLLLSA